MLQIYTIPAFTDNYFWLLQPNSPDRAAYIIDPGNAAAVMQALDQYKLLLKAILITHHHHDHIDGAADLAKNFDVPIYGPDSQKIPQVTHKLTASEQLQLGTLQLKILPLPGHTLDHIGYYLDTDSEQPRLFCGDTLFAAGCGRLFDGSADQLFQSLQSIAQLPDRTLIYCAHEYTLANLRFARVIEPENTAIVERQMAEEQKRQLNIPTIPTQLLLEKRTNPFLRCHLPHIHKQVEQLSGRKLANSCAVFAALRRLKDQF